MLINILKYYHPFNRKSASCTHVSALLHGLLSISPHNFISRSEDTEEDDTLPCTSYLCQWKPPRKRKESTTKISEVVFQKHTYGKESKRSYGSLEDFD